MRYEVRIADRIARVDLDSAGRVLVDGEAVPAVIEEAKRCTESGEQKVILTALCGHGHFDMAAYEHYLSGEMEDFELSQERIDDALTRLPAVGS